MGHVAKVHYFNLILSKGRAACGMLRHVFDESSADWTKVNCKACLKRRKG